MIGKVLRRIHMISAKVTVNNRTGLHARPASQLVQLSSKFESELQIITDNDEINPKSIISVLSGGISQGTTIELRAEGPDEQDAIRKIVELIESFTE